MKVYERKGYKRTYGNRISFADAINNGKKTMYFEILVEDKKESVVVVLNSYADAMRFAMGLMVKIMEHLLESKERSKKK
jgi:hypothetical protein